MIQQACLICSCPEASKVFSYEAPDIYERAVGVSDEGYRRAWVRCTRCGFHYSRYGRDPQIIHTIYDHAYRDQAGGFRRESAEATFERIVALPPAESESARRAETILMDRAELTADGVLSAAEDRPLRMLDVGGGNGIFAYVFRQQAGGNASDWSTAIVDPGAQGRFVESYGIRYFHHRFDDAFAAGPFHLITMNYLLEHVADPREALRNAAANLAEGGALYVEVPDALAFQRKPPEDDIFNACHLWMFDPPALITLLSEVGLSSLRMRRTKSPRGHYALSVLAGRP